MSGGIKGTCYTGVAHHADIIPTFLIVKFKRSWRGKVDAFHYYHHLPGPDKNTDTQTYSAKQPREEDSFEWTVIV